MTALKTILLSDVVTQNQTQRSSGSFLIIKLKIGLLVKRTKKSNGTSDAISTTPSVCNDHEESELKKGSTFPRQWPQVTRRPVEKKMVKETTLVVWLQNC
ncbi:UNVERIFIED_CONTAM: hypothetical protein NCL1_30366 [Trichonephila clavipes]